MIDLVLCYLIIGSLLSCYWEFEEAVLFADNDVRRLNPPTERDYIECFVGFAMVGMLWPFFAFLWLVEYSPE